MPITQIGFSSPRFLIVSMDGIKLVTFVWNKPGLLTAGSRARSDYMRNNSLPCCGGAIAHEDSSHFLGEESVCLFYHQLNTLIRDPNDFSGH